MEELLRNEISTKIVQNLSKSENEINQVFGKMISISNMFYHDPEFVEAFSDDTYNYYDRMKVIDSAIGRISMQNLFDDSINNMKITFLDRDRRIYANWSMNYNDYTYLFDQEWVKESIVSKGYIIWNMSSKGYENQNGQKLIDQISIARTIIDNDYTDNILGTLLISIDQKQICDILDRYKYSELDYAFVSLQEDNVLFYNNDMLLEDEMNRIINEHGSKREGNDVLSIKDNRYLLSFYTIKLTSGYSQKQIKIFYLTDYQKLDSQISSLVTKINLLTVLFLILVFLVAYAIAQYIAKPVRVLSREMKKFKVGDLPLVLEKGRMDEIGDIYSAFYNMEVYINDLFEKLRKEQVTREKYQYESLRSKMSPHFLFNTLNTIRWMAIIRKADNIIQSIDSLAEILKYSLNGNDELVDLVKEIEVIRSYCYIQNMRFGNSYSLEINLPPDLKYCQIIKFILQPTVENVFKHAFSPNVSGGNITISVYVDGDCLKISVSDNGIGFPEDIISCFNKKDKALDNRECGIGLGIIDERIRISFGDEFGIKLCNNDHGGARVDFRLPVIYSEAGNEVASV
jgi:two-component system sensor histidine kinase YesM